MEREPDLCLDVEHGVVNSVRCHERGRGEKRVFFVWKYDPCKFYLGTLALQ